MSKEKMYFNWSTGKDAALGLYHIQQKNQFQVDKLLTTINKQVDRVSMHGLRRELMIAQIEATGIKHQLVELPAQPSMEEYAAIMEQAVQKLKKEGYEHTGFGDIFLEDLKAYREEQLSTLGIKCHFPLWKRNTKELTKEFFLLGFKAVVICINNKSLDKSFCGKEFNEDFLSNLPEDVDPCGENGEFHTFCYDGPIFKYPIRFKKGEQVFKEYKSPSKSQKSSKLGFWFQDLRFI